MLSDCDHRVGNCQFKLSFSKETKLIFLQSIGSSFAKLFTYYEVRSNIITMDRKIIITALL